MPQNSDTLDPDTRNIVRAWIAEGAAMEAHAICVIALEPPVRSGEANRLQVVEATRRSAP